MHSTVHQLSPESGPRTTPVPLWSGQYEDMTTPYSQVRNRSEAQALWAGALEDQQHEIHRILRGGLPNVARAAELKQALETARIELEAQTQSPPH